MARATKPVPPFMFGGHEIKLVLQALPGDHTMFIDDYIGPAARMAGGAPRPGSARALTVAQGLKKLEVDGEEIQMQGRQEPLPGIYDLESETVLFDYVLGLIVKENPFLLWKPDYKACFEEALQTVKKYKEAHDLSARAEEFALNENSNPT